MSSQLRLPPMSAELRAVPDVNQLLREPERVADLDPAEAKRLAPQLAMLVVAMLLRSAPAPTPPSEEAIWLNSEQITQRFGLTPAWLHEHRRVLQSVGAVSRVSRKTTLYDVKKLTRFIEFRRQSTTTQTFR